MLLYLVPFVPLVSRSILMFWYRRLARDRLEETELAREAHRTHTLTLAGFSFSAALALMLLDQEIQGTLLAPTYFVTLSFIGFLASANLQSYKGARWHDQLGTALHEVGTWGLVLTVVAVLWRGDLPAWLEWLLAATMLLTWILDHGIRLRIQGGYLGKVQANRFQ